MSDPIRLTKRMCQVLDRLQRGGLMVRQASDSLTAINGDGYLYSTHPDGFPVSPATASFFLQHGIVVSRRDDLFADVDGGGQVFALASPMPAVRRPKARRRK